MHEDDATTPERDAEQPAAEQPTTEQPAVEQPITEQPTTEQPATVQPQATSERRPGLDGRTLAVAAAGFALVVLAFVAGLAVADHDRDDDERRGAPMGRPDDGDRRGGAGFGHRGERGGDLGPRGGGYGRGAVEGGPRGGAHGGGMGVVTEVSRSRLTFEPIHGDGSGEAVSVELDEDTTFLARGDAGPRDIEEVDADTITEGAIVMVRTDHDDDSDDDVREAEVVMVLRAGE